MTTIRSNFSSCNSNTTIPSSNNYYGNCNQDKKTHQGKGLPNTKGIKSFYANISNNIKRTRSSFIKKNISSITENISSKSNFLSVSSSNNDVNTIHSSRYDDNNGGSNIVHSIRKNHILSNIVRSNSSALIKAHLKNNIINKQLISNISRSKSTINRDSQKSIYNTKGLVRCNSSTALEVITSNGRVSLQRYKTSKCGSTSNIPESSFESFNEPTSAKSELSSDRLTRNKVSIPPSARNRDSSARPESFRLSSDMASHTRVLLKARSFADYFLKKSGSSSDSFSNTLPLRKLSNHGVNSSKRGSRLSPIHRSLSVSGSIHNYDRSFSSPSNTSVSGSSISSSIFSSCDNIVEDINTLSFQYITDNFNKPARGDKPGHSSNKSSNVVRIIGKQSKSQNRCVVDKEKTSKLEKQDNQIRIRSRCKKRPAPKIPSSTQISTENKTKSTHSVTQEFSNSLQNLKVLDNKSKCSQSRSLSFSAVNSTQDLGSKFDRNLHSRMSDSRAISCYFKGSQSFKKDIMPIISSRPYHREVFV